MPYFGCSNYTNGKPPTGCVATSTAQIMMFYQYPSSFNWSAMPLTSGSSSTAALMADVGNKVGMNYDCNGSGTDLKYAATALKNYYGYSSATYNNTYNYNTVRDELMAKRPVILGGGRNNKWWFFNVFADGHAWVADGVRIFDDYRCDLWWDGDSWANTASYLYFHMNWGWGGQYDGWYAFNSFNPDTNDFNFKTTMITNIRP